MIATVKISQASLQGRPAVPLPHRVVPDRVTPLRGGAIFDGQTMTDTVGFTAGMETYGEKHSVKWQEGSAFAAESSYHGYSGTAAPHMSVPGITLYASDFGTGLLGAQALHQLMDFLIFCTKPWSKLGQPPLLFVSIGRRSFYGYLEGFDPTIQEFMADGAVSNGAASGLPYSVGFSLSFLVEPLGTAALSERSKTLPRTVGLKGGSGGYVDPTRLSNGALTPTAAATGAAAAAAAKAGGAVGAVPLAGGFGASVGAALGKLPTPVSGGLTNAIKGFTLGRK